MILHIKKDFSYYNRYRVLLNPTEQSCKDAHCSVYVRLTLNYDLPEKSIGVLFIKSASVYVSGRNLFPN